jgi:hypothetical protein
MAHSTIPEHQQQLYKAMIELGGGKYQGVQKGMPEIGLAPLILFCGPCGSTLALSPVQVSARRVRAEIAKKEQEFTAYADKACTFVLRQFATEAE